MVGSSFILPGVDNRVKSLDNDLCAMGINSPESSTSSTSADELSEPGGERDLSTFELKIDSYSKPQKITCY